MTFLQRQRTLSHKLSKNVANKDKKGADKRLPELPSSVVHPLKNADSKQSGLLKRVGSIFSSRKRPNLELQHIYKRRASLDVGSIHSSGESEMEIRCPSGLGSAVSISSSLPPSPFYPPTNSGPYSSVSNQLKRAASSPNLLRSFSLRVKAKTRGRRASLVAERPLPELPAKPHVSSPGSLLPENIISLILTHLPRANITSCATVSPIFASAARSALYSELDTGSITTTKLEQLISILSLRSHLAELVTSFTCPEWPPFFVSTREQDALPSQQRDRHLTAMFTLALQRMSNLTTLTLPSFDAKFVAHHTSFGLRSISFLHSTMSEAETKALFAWLDGQVNICTLRFPNLFDFDHRPGLLKTRASSPRLRTTSDTGYLSPPMLTHSPSPSPSPSLAASSTPSISTPNATLFTSPTLLPNLATLHATPSLVISLSSHLENSITTRRPLRSVFLNINSTLYSGLRPASLMSAVTGISHLGLLFSSSVDRRSFEKVIGAAGASLGSSAEEHNGDPVVAEKKPLEVTTRSGLRTLQISFQTPGVRGRDEVVYRSLQASLPRYNSLSTLKFSIQNPINGATQSRPATVHDMMDSWHRACPTLTSIALFSGTVWTQHQKYTTEGERPIGLETARNLLA